MNMFGEDYEQITPLMQFRKWATMAQVCFAAISSNHACHHGLHCSQFSVPVHAFSVRLSRCSLAGVGAGIW